MPLGPAYIDIDITFLIVSSYEIFELLIFQCVENVSRGNCPVCLEDIHTSRIPSHIPICGHLLHRTCFEQLLKAGHYACPICQTSLMDMAQLWKFLDNEIAHTPMPLEYRDYIVKILCKDCHKVSLSLLEVIGKPDSSNNSIIMDISFQKGSVKFHLIGFKCKHCGSYNTCRITAPTTPPGKKYFFKNV